MVKRESESYLFVCSVVLEDSWQRHHTECLEHHQWLRQKEVWNDWVEEDEHGRMVLANEPGIDQADRLCIQCANLDYEAMCNFSWSQHLEQRLAPIAPTDF